MDGILFSITGGYSGFQEASGLLAKQGFKLLATGKPGLAYVKAGEQFQLGNRVSEGNLLALLLGFKLGVVPMRSISLARPFDIIISTERSQDLNEAVSEAIRSIMSSYPGRRVRVRVKGHGLGIASTLRQLALSQLMGLGKLHSDSSTIILNIEAVLRISGNISVFIGLFPKTYLVRRWSVIPISSSQ